MSKNTFFKEKVSFLVLGNFRWNHYFYSFSWFTLFWSKKKFWPKQIVCTKMRVFFSLPDTNSVRQFLLKIHFFCFFTFLDDHLKKTYFYRVFGPFPFSFFSFFCFYFSNIKKEKTKNAIFFSKTSFLTSPKFCKNTILTHCCTICVSKNAQKHYKTGEKQWKKKLGPVFNFKLGPVFNFKTPKSWTSF